MMLVTFFLLVVFIAGCDATGSLSEKEEESLMDFLVDEDYIDDKVKLLTDGVGEGELHLFYNDVFVDGDDCVLNVQQAIREDDYRVFAVSIKDEEKMK